MNNFLNRSSLQERAGYARSCIEIPEDTYVPSRDNPMENVRPGADDHRKYASLNSHVMAVYKDRGHV